MYVSGVNFYPNPSTQCSSPSFGLQFAVASGATVIATSSSNAKLQIAKRLGAKHLINYNDTPEWDTEVMNLTEGRGVDHILEVGGPGTLEKSMKAVRFGGSIHLIGFLAQVSGLNFLAIFVL